MEHATRAAVALLVLAGSAGAFAPAMMGMSTGTQRRQLIAEAAAVAVALPLAANAAVRLASHQRNLFADDFGRKGVPAPVVDVTSSRGQETGELDYIVCKSGDTNDELCARVAMNSPTYFSGDRDQEAAGAREQRGHLYRRGQYYLEYREGGTESIAS